MSGLNMYLNFRVHGSIRMKDKNSIRNGVNKIVRYKCTTPELPIKYIKKGSKQLYILIIIY
jgi:membrane-bound inhibitor of C-type lysozyme